MSDQAEAAEGELLSMKTSRYRSLFGFLGALLFPLAAFAGSETPPSGPPWKTDFTVAHREALRTGKPIFIYFTKTYCPHCVVMEKELLSKSVLEPTYSKAVWMYVFRDFSGSDADRAAERVSLRFGLTSWPQHILVDPATLTVIGDTGRTAERFQSAVDRAGGRVKASQSTKFLARIEQANARARQLEQQGSVDEALTALEDEDIVVRFRALELLTAKQPELVSQHAATLLKTPNDPFRFEVCKALAASGTEAAAEALHELVQRPANSRNPNVLRIQAVTALARCGNAKSISVIAPHASSGLFLNSLTLTSVRTLSALGSRDPELRQPAIEVLKQSYPVPPANPTAVQARYCTNLARQVHASLESLTGRQIAFPEQFTAESRAKLIQSW